MLCLFYRSGLLHRWLGTKMTQQSKFRLVCLLDWNVICPLFKALIDTVFNLTGGPCSCVSTSFLLCQSCRLSFYLGTWTSPSPTRRLCSSLRYFCIRATVVAMGIKALPGVLPRFETCHLIFLSAGSRCAESRNTPPEKEAGAVHGSEPCEFVLQFCLKLLRLHYFQLKGLSCFLLHRLRRITSVQFI